MFCSKCGTELPEDSRFCPSCGNKIAEPVIADRSAPKESDAITHDDTVFPEEIETFDVSSNDAPVKRNVVGIVLRWIFCVLFVLLGFLSMIASYPIAGAVCILSGILISPFIDSLIPKIPVWSRVVLSAVIVVFLAPAISGYIDPGPSIKPVKADIDTPISTPTATVYDGMTIVDSVHFTYSEYGTTYLEGTVENVSGEDIRYAQISFSLFDKEGNQVGTALDNISNFSASGTWKYKAIVLDDGVYSAELAKLIGW